MMTQPWQTFADPKFTSTFDYPTVTDEGDPRLARNQQALATLKFN